MKHIEHPTRPASSLHSAGDDYRTRSSLRFWAMASGLALLFSARLAAAEEPQIRDTPAAEKEHSSEHRSQHQVFGLVDAIGRANPVGLALLTGLFYKNVWARDPDTQYDMGYVQAGASGLLTPSYGQPSVSVEVLPLPFLALRAEYALQAFFGANRGLLGFERADQAFGDEELDARNDQAEKAVAHRLGGEVVLRGKVGRVVARNTSQLYYYKYNTSSPYVYESEFDTLLGKEDGLWDDRVQIGYDLSSQATPALTLLGPFYEITQTFGTDLRRQRVGAFFFTETDSWLGLRQPRLYALAGVNVEDTNRQNSVFFLLGMGTSTGG